MKELQRAQNQEDLVKFYSKKNPEEAYKAKVKHLEGREKELKNELKSIEPTKKKA